MKDYGEELEGRIAAYIDGKLPPAEAARLEVFLANSDPALAEQVITMIADRHAVRTLPKPHAPEDLAARIMEQVERTSLLNDSEHFAAPRRPWWQSRLAVAAALFLILGGFSWFILEAVRRPDSSWRQTVMNDDGQREVSRDLAAAQKTEPTPLPSAASAPTAIVSAAPAIAGTAAARAGAPASASPATADTASPSRMATALQPAAAPQPVSGLDKQPAEPLEITLVARAPGDEERLRAELARFAEANPAGQLVANTVQSTNAPQVNNTGVAAESQSTNQFGASAARAQNQAAQNNSNSTEQLAARGGIGGGGSFENSAAGQQAGSKNAAQNATQTPRNFQYYDNKRRTFENLAESRPLKDESALQSPAPYRLSLRPDQLRQLTADFAVQSESPATPNAPAAPASAAAPAGLGADALSATQPAQKPLAAYLKEKPADAPIDCIITLLPAPAATQSH